MELNNYTSHSNVSSISTRRTQEDDEEALKWAALERLPTYERARKGILHGVTGGLVEVDLQELRSKDRKNIVGKFIKHVEDNEMFLHKLKNRIDRVSLELPTIEVRFENLNVEAEVYVGGRALPTVVNSLINIIEGAGICLHMVKSRKKKLSLLHDVSGIIKPGRMSLLLGPPGSGKTILLKTLTGKMVPGLKVSGNMTYNGHEMKEFVPQRTAAYIDQYDIHFPDMTVRETLEFSAKCQGVGSSYDVLIEVLRREKQMKIHPDPYIDAFMKASILNGNNQDIATEYILKILGLDVCADTIIGNDMMRGISGGQKKRVTIGEMLVGPVNAFFMDNISTGLDSSTTFQIVNSIKHSVHIFNKTALISLLQPTPDTYELFDDVILFGEGQIVYQGPREHVLEFFESMGFRCPERKGVADFLQEVTSRKDQRQYWDNEERQYRYVSVNEFAEAFNSFHVGKAIRSQLATSYDRSKSHSAALARSKYGTSKKELIKASLSRELTLIKRNLTLYIFKSIQIEFTAFIVATVFAQARKHHRTVEDGTVFLGALYFGLNNIIFASFVELPMTIGKLPVFFKQRDLLFYPSWAFSLPKMFLGIPLTFLEVTLWTCTTYYSIGFDHDVTRFFKQFLILFVAGQTSYSLFRCIAALARDPVVANTSAMIAVLWVAMFGGFILSHNNMKKWLVWGYWTSPIMYAQNAITTNEFLGRSWSHVLEGSKESVGILILKSRGIFTDPNWYWIGIGACIGFIFLFNAVSSIALAYLNEYGKSQAVFLSEETMKEKHAITTGEILEGEAQNPIESDTGKTFKQTADVGSNQKKGELIPFIPLCITFENIIYSVDVPKEMKASGVSDDRLELLKSVSGSFRPGVLTALMGLSGAGKTTLLDVLAGRKNSGTIEGNIKISGYPKKQETFARVSGYCEQNDIHSPLVTVYESLVYSAWLRLPPEVDSHVRELFIEEIMELIELTSIRDAMVGYPNVNGLSIEQRKRLTIAVELVANPSIVFMDEPTSGLDARAAAIVMRTVRNTVDTGRTVVCTIHQPSIDIFESFDELFLLTRGGEEIYVGPIGRSSQHLLKYFEGIVGAGKMKDGYNPATWALEVSTRQQEEVLGIDFADVYKNSDLFRRNKALIQELSIPPPNSQDLHFPTRYSQSYLSQVKACLWKLNKSYWRNVPYTGIRFLCTTIIAFLFGLIFWDIGSQRGTKQDLFSALGAMYTAITFMGSICSYMAQPVFLNDRTIFYREKAAGMYSALPYAIAQALIEIPYTVAQAIIYSVIVYAMIGYEWTAAKFLLNLFCMGTTFFYYVYFGMMLIAITPNQSAAAIISGVFNSTWSLFSGFLIPRPRVAIWWRWYSWLCPTAWSFYGLTVSQYGDVQTKLDTGETVAEFVENYFGFRYDLIWLVCIVLVGFVLIFSLASVSAMKILNFQKR